MPEIKDQCRNALTIVSDDLVDMKEKLDKMTLSKEDRLALRTLITNAQDDLRISEYYFNQIIEVKEGL